MHKCLFFKFACAILLVFIVSAPLFANDEQIKFVVYSKAGGLIDTTTRQLTKIIEKNNSNLTLIVENYPGAAGLKALNFFNKQSDAGLRVLAITNSFISQIAALGQKNALSKIDYLAMVAKDYECLIVHQDQASLAKLRDLNSQRKLIWSGPSAGGTDYMFANRAKYLLKLNGDWLPYKSGKRGMLAVLGGYADIYTGNPGDTIGFNDLKVLGVASSQRLSNFPDVPTFEELGYGELTGEVLWRGYAVSKSLGAEQKKFLSTLLQEAVTDADWLDYLGQRSVESVFIEGESFRKIVELQLQQDQNLIADQEKNIGNYWHYLLLALLLLAVLLRFMINTETLKLVRVDYTAVGILLLSIIAISGLGYYLSMILFLVLYTFYKKLSTLTAVVSLVLWLAFAFLVFQETLQVPLPSSPLDLSKDLMWFLKTE